MKRTDFECMIARKRYDTAIRAVVRWSRMRISNHTEARVWKRYKRAWYENNKSLQA